MRVLVVEDEREIRSFIKKSLELECLTVEAAEDGEQALDMLKEKKYDLIVMDYSMPKKNGLETLIELRKKKEYTPVLMLSVRSETSTKVEFLNAGADDYLTKPFSLDEFLARTKALLRRPRNIGIDVLQIDNLSLDIVKHEVKRGEALISLTRKEFMLLEYFMRNIGTVLSRAMIMDQVWGMSADPFSNTIESHMKSLRKKIDTDGQRQLFQAMVGGSYKLEIAG